DRWAAKWEHFQRLPGTVDINIDMKLMSDNQYLLDFRDDGLGRSSDRYLEAKGFIARPFNAYNFVAEASYYDDLQSPDNLDRDEFILQRFPQLTFTVLPQRLGPIPIVASLDIEGTNFIQLEDARNELEVFENTPDPDGFPALVDNRFFDMGVDALFDEQEPFFSANRRPDPNADNFNRILNPEGTEGDGVFEEGEILIADGQRLNIQPHLAIPFRLGNVARVHPEAGWRETLYYANENVDRHSSRSTFTSLVKVQSSIEKVYDFSDGGPEGRRMKHVLEPEATYLFLSPTNQDNTPVFVPRNTVDDTRLLDFALENRLFDPADRYPDESRLIGAISNYLFGRSGSGRFRRLLELKVGQGY
ncbi:MAG: LPS assembly protein LptD, partial [Vicinamibacteria bacterium]